MLTPESCQWLRGALAEILGGDPSLNTHDRIVLVALVWHGYRTLGEECWPSVQALVHETGLSRHSVQRALERLTQKKRIHRTRRPVTGDRHEPNLYRVDVCRRVGAPQAPTWVPPRHPNRISETSLISGTEIPLSKPARISATPSSLEISETPSLPASRAGALCEFVPPELVRLAEKVFGDHRRRLVASALRKFRRELDRHKITTCTEELSRFLRYQAQYRSFAFGRSHVSLACNVDEFLTWRKKHERKSVPPKAPPQLVLGPTGRLVEAATLRTPAVARPSR